MKKSRQKWPLALTFAMLAIILVSTPVIERKTPLEENEEEILALIGSLVLLSGIISYQTRISTSIIELVVGSLAALTPLSRVANDPTLDVLARLGAIVLMFIAGTEIDVNILRGNIKASSILGFSSFLLPFSFSAIALYLMGYHDIRTPLIATGVATTSVAIVYMVLKDLGIFNTSIGQAMFAGAMITDVVSMLVLSVVLGRLSIMSMLYIPVILVMLMLPKSLERIIKLESAWDLELKFILLILIVLALISETLGVHSAITSFILGIAFGETVKSHEYIDKKIKGLGFGFFVPIFFFKAGLLMKYPSLSSVLWKFIVILVIAVIAKYIAALAPLKVFFKLKNNRLPFLFNARLAIGTLAAVYGLEYGMISSEEYSMIIGIVVLSSVLVAIVLRRMPYMLAEELVIEA